MRHASIDRLKLQQDWGQQEVAKALVPDMNKWVSMWIIRAGNSLKGLLQQLQYTEPLELLTCFACLLGDSAIDKHSAYELHSASHAITKERARVKSPFLWSCRRESSSNCADSDVNSWAPHPHWLMTYTLARTRCHQHAHC